MNNGLRREQHDKQRRKREIAQRQGRPAQTMTPINTMFAKVTSRLIAEHDDAHSSTSARGTTLFATLRETLRNTLTRAKPLPERYQYHPNDIWDLRHLIGNLAVADDICAGNGDTTMKQALTDRLLRSLAAPSPEPREIWDQTVRGFGVRISAGGKVSFFVMRRQRGIGRPIRITLGSFPLLSLAEARERSRALLRDLEAGIDRRSARS